MCMRVCGSGVSLHVTFCYVLVLLERLPDEPGQLALECRCFIVPTKLMGSWKVET